MIEGKKEPLHALRVVTNRELWAGSVRGGGGCGKKGTRTGKVFGVQFHHRCWAATKRPTSCWALEVQHEAGQEGSCLCVCSAGGHRAEAPPWLPEEDKASLSPGDMGVCCRER